MKHEIHTFKEWGYPFIAQDFQDAAGVDCSGLLLGGIILEDSDVFDAHAWPYVIAQVADFMRAKVPAIMVELSYLTPKYREAAEHDLGEYFIRNGYTNLESYEDRLAYGKFPKGELK